MRTPIPILATIGAACLLVACGKPPVSAETPPHAPTAFTHAEMTAALATLPAAFRHADLDNGEAKFALCRSCHTARQGEIDMTGPNLFGIFGRQAGSKPGFAYSEGLKAAGFTWDAPRIERWIASPRAMIPGTKMTYLGMEDRADRIDVVAYLKLETTARGRS
jgi:cytochrome c